MQKKTSEKQNKTLTQQLSLSPELPCVMTFFSWSIKFDLWLYLATPIFVSISTVVSGPSMVFCLIHICLCYNYTMTPFNHYFQPLLSGQLSRSMATPIFFSVTAVVSGTGMVSCLIPYTYLHVLKIRVHVCSPDFKTADSAQPINISILARLTFM